VKADGTPAEVLTPENLRETYRIEAKIGEGGEPFVLPIRRSE
jgi:ABC-type cobalamin/Fe3+-siderophores transport system ATPase subunit